MLYKGPFKCYVMFFSGNLTPTHPLVMLINNIVTLFSGKCDTPHPDLRYVTLEWPLNVITVIIIVLRSRFWRNCVNIIFIYDIIIVFMIIIHINSFITLLYY